MNKKYLIGIVSFMLLFSCQNESECDTCAEDLISESVDTDFEIDSSKELEKEEVKIVDTSDLEHYLIEKGLMNVQSLAPEIMVDLKYASIDNFLGINLYGDIQNAYLQPDIAERLAKVQDYLNEEYPNLKLYIFDAVRPVSVQHKMWVALDSIPINERVKYVSNPKNHSIHNYGAAIDLSLYDTIKDTLLDMGAGFDDFHVRAYPSKEKEMLEKGVLTSSHIENRELLRKVMKIGGFWVLPSEWWHFNGVNREEAKKKYEVVEFED